MSEFEVEAGTPVWVFKKGTNQLEMKHLKRTIGLDRKQLLFHAFQQPGEWVMLVPVHDLNCARLDFPSKPEV